MVGSTVVTSVHCLANSRTYAGRMLGEWGIEYLFGKVVHIVDLSKYFNSFLILSHFIFVQSAGTVEYTDCTSAEE